MKNRKYHTVGIIPKSNIKIVDRGKRRESVNQRTDNTMAKRKRTKDKKQSTK